MIPDPPLREKDRAAKVWDRWFEAIKNAFNQTHIADASISHAVTDFSETNAALDALGAKINTLLSELETSGILKSS